MDVYSSELGGNTSIEKYIFIGSFKVVGRLKAFSQEDNIHIIRQACQVEGFEQFAIHWPHDDLDDDQFKWVDGPIVGWLRNKGNCLFATICEQYLDTEFYPRALSNAYRKPNREAVEAESSCCHTWSTVRLSSSSSILFF